MTDPSLWLIEQTHGKLTAHLSLSVDRYAFYDVCCAQQRALILILTSDTLKCRVPRSALWRRGPLWQIPNIVCWGLGDFDFEVLG